MNRPAPIVTVGVECHCGAWRGGVSLLGESVTVGVECHYGSGVSVWEGSVMLGSECHCTTGRDALPCTRVNPGAACVLLVFAHTGTLSPPLRRHMPRLRSSLVTGSRHATTGARCEQTRRTHTGHACCRQQQQRQQQRRLCDRTDRLFLQSPALLP